MPLPSDYVERVYAGVLGKIIGVYLGRPFEGWSYERIMAELGDITGYVHAQRGVPLIVTDDDITGTFTFLRALPDYGNRRDLTPAQIGQTWLNYIIENKTILWWGGMGNSTEHTAYLRLKRGIAAPASGSIALNGQVVAEQIGSQIFIDGWAMVTPGDPAFAADLARRAASVSHDGEAIYGAQLIAAMEAQAFVEHDLNTLLDVGLSCIPRDSVTARMIHDIREWHAETPDWRTARELLARHYGYARYGGNCHIIPNHGLIILSLLYGDDDFARSLQIVNTSGWDTDCNSGNVGCLLGIKNGLAGIDASAYDWRGPVADRLYLPTAEGGRAISDAVAETYQVVNIGRALANQPPLAPKDGARFHFSLPGSVQGFLAEDALTLRNAPSPDGSNCLALELPHGGSGQAATATFTPPEALTMVGYTLLAAPTLYPGQTVRARVTAAAANQQDARCHLFVRAYNTHDQLDTCSTDARSLAPGTTAELDWTIAATDGQPIAQVGIAVASAAAAVVYLEMLDWRGEPDAVFKRPDAGGKVWRRAWVEAIDQCDGWWPETFRLVHNDGRGMLSTGTREWQRYTVTTTITPHMCDACGVAARVQGLQRYYALLMTQTHAGQRVARIIRMLDGETVLHELPYDWAFGVPYALTLHVNGSAIRAQISTAGQSACELVATDNNLTDGGIALIVENGRAGTDDVRVA